MTETSGIMNRVMNGDPETYGNGVSLVCIHACVYIYCACIVTGLNCLWILHLSQVMIMLLYEYTSYAIYLYTIHVRKVYRHVNIIKICILLFDKPSLIMELKIEYYTA